MSVRVQTINSQLPNVNWRPPNRFWSKSNDLLNWGLAYSLCVLPLPLNPSFNLPMPLGNGQQGVGVVDSDIVPIPGDHRVEQLRASRTCRKGTVGKFEAIQFDNPGFGRVPMVDVIAGALIPIAVTFLVFKLGGLLGPLLTWMIKAGRICCLA